MAKLNLKPAEQIRVQLTIKQQKQIEQIYKGVAKDIDQRVTKIPNVSSAPLQRYYLENLKKDIDNYKTLNKKIVQSSVSDSNDITYATVKGASCAYVNAYYFSKEGSNYSRTYQEFVLRKDSKGKWKILTFRLTEGEDNE